MMAKENPTHHQFSLFGFQKPKAKVPISKERIEAAKRLIDSGDHKSAVQKLREVNDQLQKFLDRL